VAFVYFHIKNQSRVVGRKIEDIALPKGATIAAIVRRAVPLADDEIACPIGKDDTVIIAHHDTVIEKNDHVIVFAVSRQLVPKIEKLFSVGVGFF
jgi:trk system potassium uptake protein TrkA